MQLSATRPSWRHLPLSVRSRRAAPCSACKSRAAVQGFCLVPFCEFVKWTAPYKLPLSSYQLPLASSQLPVAPCSDKFNNVTGLAPYVRDRKVFRRASRIRQTFQNEIMSGQPSGRKKCKQIWPSGNRDKRTHTHPHTHTLRVCLPTNTYEITCTHVPGQGAVCCPVDSGTTGQWGIAWRHIWYY